MDYLPVFMNVAEKPCLVVGGGDVAERKVAMLERAGARPVIVAPKLGAGLAERHAAGDLEWHPRDFRPSDLDGPCLVIAATDDRAVNQAVSREAGARRLPVNVVDDPELCGFIMPAVIDRDPIQIAISTGGASPVLARLLRARLEALVPRAWGDLAAFAGRFRARVKEVLPDAGQRRRFWERVLDGPMAERFLAGQRHAARQLFDAELAGTTSGGPGQVALVGAGPGDPELLTFRALRLMQAADIVVYDHLVAPAIVDMARRDAEFIYAGKQRSRHTLPQPDINELLIRKAREGLRVVRLKGGDPFVFGRGGEEIAALVAEDIPFQIVPGITAASGCTAYAGIPLTHRDYAQSCLFVTGHRKHGELDLDWEGLARPHQTVVFYMGLQGSAEICQQLIQNGRDATTPAALLEQGTTAHQRVIEGTLDTLPRLIARSDARAPTLLVVGEVVPLRHELGWFEPEGEPGANAFEHMQASAIASTA